MIDEQAGHAGRSFLDDVLDERSEVEAGAGNAEDVIAVADQYVDPQFGDAQIRVWIDVDVDVALLADQIVEPGVLFVARVHDVAEFLPGVFVLCVVVEVVTVAEQGDEIAVVLEILAEVLHFLDGAFGQLGVVWFACPLADRLGRCQLAR